MIEDPGRHRRARTLADELERRIRDERMSTGRRLGSKDDLRRAHGVASATINEAVRLLEHRGIVEARPGRRGGVFVSPSSPNAGLAELLHSLVEPGDAAWGAQVLDALAPVVVEEASRHCSQRDARELDFLYERLAAAVGEVSSYLAARTALHRRIADIAPNRLLAELYRALVDASRSHALETVDATTDLARQRHLVDAIRDAGASRD